MAAVSQYDYYLLSVPTSHLAQSIRTVALRILAAFLGQAPVADGIHMLNPHLPEHSLAATTDRLQALTRAFEASLPPKATQCLLQSASLEFV